MSNSSFAVVPNLSGIKMFGMSPAGISDKVAKDVGKLVIKAFMDDGKNVDVKSLRFLPSTRSSIGSDFQIVANATVEVATNGIKRSRMVESVITIGNDGHHAVLKDVKVPALER